MARTPDCSSLNPFVESAALNASFSVLLLRGYGFISRADRSCTNRAILLRKTQTGEKKMGSNACQPVAEPLLGWSAGKALDEFARFDPRRAQVVELRYFGGLSVEETAEVLGVHANTVIRDWSLAKVWLKRELSQKDADAG